MRNYRIELWLALLAICIATLVYMTAGLRLSGLPAPGSPAGRILGALGMILMLITQTVYSARKRSRQAARWGSMESWLRAHMVTGMLGAYLIILHSSWRFSGLAGIVILLMFLIIISGFVGRYIYTAVPRTDGGDGPETGGPGFQREVCQSQLAALHGLGLRPQKLHQRIAAMVFQRQSLSCWYFVHVPLGLTLFALAFFHIGAAAYYLISAR